MEPGRSRSTAPRQAGIVTAAQDRLHFAAFDLTATTRAEVVDLLREWTVAAAADDAGEPAGPRNTEPLLPPDDTGEAMGHLPSRLTITFGFGPGLFERGGVDRFGLAAERPQPLRQLPPLPAEAIDPARSRRRPLRAGVLRRPAGRVPRGPQPGADRARHGRDALVAARLRAHRRPRPASRTRRAT